MGPCTEKHSIKSQCHQSSVDNNSDKQIFCVSGTYPNDIRDDLVNSNRCIENDNSVKKVPILPVNNTIIKTATNGNQIINRQALVSITTQGVEIEVPVLLIKDLVYDVILGTDTLNKINVVINFNNNTMMCMVNNKDYSVKLGHIDIKSESVAN